QFHCPRGPDPGDEDRRQPARRPPRRAGDRGEERLMAAEAKEENATQEKEGPYRTAAPAPKSIVKLRGIFKTFWRGKEPVRVLENLDLDVPEGSFEALMGPSGSGKSTLLNLIAGLDRATKGTIEVAGADLGGLSDSGLAKWRARTIGFIFQAYNL